MCRADLSNDSSFALMVQTKNSAPFGLVEAKKMKEFAAESGGAEREPSAVLHLPEEVPGYHLSVERI